MKETFGKKLMPLVEPQKCLEDLIKRVLHLDIYNQDKTSLDLQYFQSALLICYIVFHLAYMYRPET